MRRTKTLILTLAGAAVMSLPLCAQPNGPIPHESPAPAVCDSPLPPDHKSNKEQLESAKIAFFTTRMNLTPEEAGKFWPVYNEYQKALTEARKASREEFHALRKLSESASASEVQIKKALMEYLDNSKKDDELQRLYLDEFLKILPAEKVLLMYIAEEDFRIKMIRMWKKPGMEKEK